MKTNKALLMVLLTTLMMVSTSAVAGVLVDVHWLKAHKNDSNLVVVDVQNKPGSYEKGHIPGAVRVLRHVDLEDPTRYPTNAYPQKQQFLDLMARLGIDNNTTIVAYDDKPSVFASRMLFVMELYGHDVNKLKLLDGGITQWKAAGQTISTTPSKTPNNGRYTTNGPNLNMVVSWSDVFRDVVQKQNSDVLLLDARPLAEFNGSKIRTIRGGHIPQAINVEGVKAANNKDHTFKNLSQIRSAFTKAGVTPDKIIYTYCHSADRAAHAYVVLKNMLGYPNVKVYEGSWNEWGTMTALPAADEEYK